ncbi:MAG TPA: MBL fold metallo-hydrolase [Acidimicrobiales bacterium]|nr:MBL fold metallo-hydrolase [Acidimicrobiales bacterium]
MVARWLRHGLWRPFELACRRSPLVPFRVTVAEPVAGVRVVRIDNAVTRLIGRIGGGYDYSVSYLVGDELLVDTGFPWAARALRSTLGELGVTARLTHVVNTHSHEDHVGNNDVLAQVSAAQILVHPAAIPAVRWPAQVPWYRGFMFGPLTGSRVTALGARLEVGAFCFEVVATPGHTPDHVCLFEPQRGWLFAGDLYVDDRLDAQLPDVDGPCWIASLEHAISLGARVLFDGHGLVIHGQAAVREALDTKRIFLESVRDRTRREAPDARSLPELTRRVFAADGPLDRLSRQEGRLSLLTGSNFSRSHLVRSFLPTGDI